MRALMRDVYWGLGSTKYDAYDDFVAAVTEYNTAIHPEKSQWEPDRVVAEAPIRVVYEAMWKDEDDTIDLVIGEPGVPLTMGRLLFALNNATFAFFKDADTHFFEGFTAINNMTYKLAVGS